MWTCLKADVRYRWACARGYGAGDKGQQLAGNYCNAVYAWQLRGMPGYRVYRYVIWACHRALAPVRWWSK